MTLTDKMLKCNPKSMTVGADSEHTIPAKAANTSMQGCNSDSRETTKTIVGREKLELIIVEFNDICLRHRLEIRINTQFKVSLAPKNDKPVYTKCLPSLDHSKSRASPNTLLWHD